MRIESLNIWGGREKEPLLKHVREQAPQTSVFCFQEVFNGQPAHDRDVVPNIYNEIVAALPDHVGYYAPAHGPEGLATFVRRDVCVKGGGSTVVHRWNLDPSREIDQDRVLQFLTIVLDGRDITVANIHALQLGPDKGDTLERLAQFQRAKAEVVKGPTVLCGDFNVRPYTNSLLVFEEDTDPRRRLRNLVTANGIPTTRSPHYPYRDTEPFADYIFVSPPPSISCVKFMVLEDVVVSDHLPLVVEIE